MIVLISLLALASGIYVVQPSQLTPMPFVIPQGYFYEIFTTVKYSFAVRSCSVCTEWINKCSCSSVRCCTVVCSRYESSHCTNTAIIVNHNATYCLIPTGQLNDDLEVARSKIAALYPINLTYGGLLNTHVNNSCTNSSSDASTVLLNVALLLLLAGISICF